jgi:hypothetical protein
VGCSAKKARTARPAADLYMSPLFRAARRYAEATCSRWYVLSALHGLLAPEKVIEPYDQQLTPANATAWGVRVGKQLDEALPWPKFADVELVVLAGWTYAEAIDLPRDFYWHESLRGLGVGARLSWLNANLTMYRNVNSEGATS